MADKKTYILTVSNRTALARNKRLREAGASVYINGSTVTQAGTSGIDEKGVVDVAVQGAGNVITDARLNSDGSTIVLNRGLTVLDETTANARFLRKDQDDSTEYNITMGGAIVTGNAQVGGDLSITGITRMTTAYVTESIGTPQYADGFDGYGWQLSNIGENNWHLTLDSLTVRKNMTVYEMIISKIRAIGGQFIVSAANGFIKRAEDLSTEDEAFYDANGELFLADGEEFHVRREQPYGLRWAIELQDECEFVAHDLMRCQHYTGNDIKAYWVEIDEVKNGVIYVSINEFYDPLSGGGFPAVGDEVVLCGNTQDPNRQNLILISATEDGLPRIDVHQGVHEKSFNLTNEGTGETLGTIRSRLGCLDDIRDDWFDSDNQPSGYGLYAENAYLRGNFVLANSGDNVSTLFQVIQGNITAILAANEQANYLTNSSFATDMDKWVEGDGCSIVYDDLAGRNVLEMTPSDGVTASMVQLAQDYAMHPTFDKDEEGNVIARNFNLQFYAYGAAVNARFYMEGGDTTLDESITFDLTEWTYYDIAFTAKAFGDFAMEVSISTLHIRDVKIVADNVTYFTTLFSQTVGSISALATRIDNLPGQIYTTIAGLYVTTSALQEELSKYVTIEGFSGLFASAWDNEGAKGDMHSALIAAFVGKVYNEGTHEYNIESGVMITADHIYLEGLITANKTFTIDTDGTFSATAGKIGGFYIGERLNDSGNVVVDYASLYSPTNAYIQIVGDSYQMDMFANYIQFTNGDRSSLIRLGADASASLGSGEIMMGEIQVTRETSLSGYINTGLHITVEGVTVSDSYATNGNHALRISKGDICGFRLRTRRISSDTRLDVMDSVIFVTAGGRTITLPNKTDNGVEDGQVYYIKLVTSGGVTIQTSGSDVLNFNTTAGSTTSKYFSNGDLMILIYDYSYGVWRGGYTNYD